MVNERVYFERIDSTGSFPRGAIAMQVIFEDSQGREYVWTPGWEEVADIYAEAERVEETNEGGGEWLEMLRERNAFSEEVLSHIAETIATDLSESEVTGFFEKAGFPEIEYDEDTSSDKSEYIYRELAELNENDYTQVIRIVEVFTDPRRYISEEAHHKQVVRRLNMGLKHEDWKVTEEGQVQATRYGEPADDINDVIDKISNWLGQVRGRRSMPNVFGNLPEGSNKTEQIQYILNQARNKEEFVDELQKIVEANSNVVSEYDQRERMNRYLHRIDLHVTEGLVVTEQ
jgi:cell division protein ZapD